jgi:hypothetical protein
MDKAKLDKQLPTGEVTRTDWQPGEAQRRFLSVCQVHDYALPITRACTAAGIGRQTYYDWWDSADFAAWWEAQAERFFRLQLHRVHASTLTAATTKGQAEGSTADRRLFYERFDKRYKPAGDAATAPAAVTVRVDVVEIMRQMLNNIQMVPGSDCLSAGAVRRLPVAEAEVIDVEAEDR